MSSAPRIAVLIETSTSWGHRIVKGISDYATQHGPWFFYHEPRGLYDRLHLPKGWSGDGIIARVTSNILADAIVDSGTPAVDVSWFNLGSTAIPRCTVCEVRVGQMAAEHFLERGFRNFAYCGPIRRSNYIDQLVESFASTVAARGYPCDVYHSHRSSSHGADWQNDCSHLADWLTRLDKPVGVFAWSGVRGRHVTEACTYADLRVPEEVAVVGSSYDELACEMSSPPLSTVDSSGWKVGYSAAELVDRMMRGEAAPSESIEIEPNGIITRQSSDAFAVDDPLLAHALHYISRHAHEGISVKNVLDELVVGRRTLEDHFARFLHRSPAAEIRRVCLERAKRLLVDTDLSIPQVALQSGFVEHDRLTRTFQRELGTTPSSFRMPFRNQR